MSEWVSDCLVAAARDGVEGVSDVVVVVVVWRLGVEKGRGCGRGGGFEG